MDGKRVKQSALLDRISDLPNHVIDIILSRVPLRVAVKTSILSRKWRLHWTRVENVELDRDFVHDVFDGHEENDEIQPSRYVGIVSNIILSHRGPIRKFELYIPYFDEPLDVINLWILAVSRHGVQHLALDYDDQWHAQVPSYVFQCTELKELVLVNVERPPHYYEEFSSLLSLTMECSGGVYDDYVTNMTLMCPLLEKLVVFYHSNVGTFTISAPKLKQFTSIYQGHTDFIFQNTPNLSTVDMLLLPPDHDVGHLKCPNVVEFFGAVPKIENFTISGHVLSEWGVQDVPKMLPSPLENHLKFMVCKWNMYSLAQVRSMFCVINSSPSLQMLEIMIHHRYSPLHDASDYLRLQIRDAKNLWSLQNVEIKDLLGNDLEILFIEIILSCCPTLEKLYLFGDSRISSDAEFKMVTDIMQFPRASTKTKLIYSKSKQPPDDSA